MKKATIIVLFFLLATLTAFITNIDPERQWSQFRGHRSSGFLDDAGLPESWDLNTNENVLWNIEVPGLGLSSPVIWEDKLFITTAVSDSDNDGLKAGIYGSIDPVEDESEHEWKVYCIDKHSGKTIWEQAAHRGVPEQKRHPKSSHANCSVATDGNYVVAFFGSEGLYCYDMDGNLVWEKDFGVLKSTFFRVETAEWEFASSPVIYDGRLIVQCDVMENSFLAVYDLKSGKELWIKERDEYPGWCTPNIYTDNGKVRIAVNGYKHRGGYDFETGEEVWKMSGGGDIQIPTPLVGKELIYFNSAHGPKSPIMAIKKNATGDLTLNEGETSNTYVQWSTPRGGSYMQTMLLYEGLLYNLGWNGRLTCYDAASGERLYEEKLGRASSFTASPVASDGRIYVVDDEGTVYRIKSGKKFEVLSRQKLDDICMVTPAITDGAIFFRTQGRLMAFGKE
ncbi:MAG: PQQ-binding-like beta-propeller repeat protein [Cyclobacteriaceae bacterium]|nr:PQQ-binding-like beta-propeller repeat protein [Cyclobacteriaceae bacterium]